LQVKVLDPNLLDKPLSSTLGGDNITFGQVSFAHVGVDSRSGLFAFSILHREELPAGSTCQQHALHSYTG
jgi:hypothetical protein